MIDLKSPRNIILVGGGRFGRLALQRLGSRIGRIIELQPGGQLRKLAREAGAEIIPGQGVGALIRILGENGPPVWVIPAVPQHLLVDWLLITLAKQGIQRRTVPDEALPRVPSLTRGADGQMLLSLADFLCPDDCPEPALNCTVTGRPRGLPLYQRLAKINLPGWSTGVLRSRQLAPGVGGYPSSDLLALKQRIQQHGGCWLIGTACRCHGIVGALRLGVSR